MSLATQTLHVSESKDLRYLIMPSIGNTHPTHSIDSNTHPTSIMLYWYRASLHVFFHSFFILHEIGYSDFAEEMSQTKFDQPFATSFNIMCIFPSQELLDLFISKLLAGHEHISKDTNCMVLRNVDKKSCQSAYLPTGRTFPLSFHKIPYLKKFTINFRCNIQHTNLPHTIH